MYQHVSNASNVSTSINMYQNVSTSINMYQSGSKCIALRGGDAVYCLTASAAAHAHPGDRRSNPHFATGVPTPTLRLPLISFMKVKTT